MKKRNLFILMLISVLSLTTTACGGSNSGETAPAVKQEQSESELSAGAHAGTRTDPYEFGDDITFSTKAADGQHIVEYTINFSEMWGSGKIQNEYPGCSLKDRILARGEINVKCDSTDDEINFDLVPVFVTESLNEEAAGIERYKSGKIDNPLSKVYSGGTYDVIVLGAEEGIGSMTVSYLKIAYINKDGESTNLWITVPEDIKDEPVNETEEPQNEDKSDESETVEPLPEMTYEELENALLNEPMYVEKTEYLVQDTQYKNLYPDMLQAVVKNNSGTDIKNAVIAFVAWDSNGFPVKIKTEFDFRGGDYVVEAQCSDINLIDGATYGESSGLSLDSDTDNIATFKAIVVSYDDFDKNTWKNPYYDVWVDMYKDKRLNQ